MENNNEVQTIPVKKERQTGFEILRILAMILICAVHVMNSGGMLANAGGGGISLIGQKILYSIFTVSVNVFVLISGYFLVQSKFKAKKVILLWCEVMFYSVLTYLLYCLFNHISFNIREFIRCFFPVIYNKFWFFSAYILVYLASPFLNKILNNSNKKELSFLMIGLFVLTYVATRFNISSVAAISNGYNVFWFIILYLFGGYLRLYPPKVKKPILLLIYIVCTGSLFGMTFMPTNLFIERLIYNSLDYTSPLVLIASISLLLLFKDIKVKNKFIHNFICFISSCTFGIYLYHCSLLFNFISVDILKVPSVYGSPYSALWVLAFALAIFSIGVVVECVRKIFVILFKFVIGKIKEAKQKKQIIKIEAEEKSQ